MGMAFQRSNVGLAIAAPPHESGAANRPTPALCPLLLPQAQWLRKRDGFASLHAGCLVAQIGKPRCSHTTFWLWFVLLTFLLSTSGVYSAEDITAGNCRYNLISVAAFSCLRPNGALRQLSFTCCKALLYAVDFDPSSSQSGACCLCRYMRAKGSRCELARAYVLCKGKDKHAVKKWTSFPMTKCSEDCRKIRNSSPGMDNSVHEDHPLEHSHNTGKAKDSFHIYWAIVVIFVSIGLSSLWCILRFKLSANASVQGGRLSPNGGPQAYSSRSPVHSTNKRKGRKS